MSLSISPSSDSNYNAKAIQFVVEYSVSCYIKYKTTKLIFFFLQQFISMACLKISIELNRGFKPPDVFNRDVQSLNPPNLKFFLII